MTGDMKVGLIRVDQIQFHPHNIRTDLGDLRPLTDSIRRYGVMQPIVVEDYGDQLRLRAGHRRVAAARLAGLKRIPAVIHPTALDDDEWLLQSVQENVMRRNLDHIERNRTVLALRELGCSWRGIADAFGVTRTTIDHWLADHDDPTRQHQRDRQNAHKRAAVQLIRLHQAEFDQLFATELGTTQEVTA